MERKEGKDEEVNGMMSDKFKMTDVTPLETSKHLTQLETSNSPVNYQVSNGVTSSESEGVGVREDKQEVYIHWLRQAASRPVVKEKLYAHAWEVAQAAAWLLKERYGVSRVRVFGSLTHAGRFHEGSDIDMAVEGLKPDDYWEAVTSVLFLDDGVPVELVDVAVCRPEIWKVVEQEGVDL